MKRNIAITENNAPEVTDKIHRKLQKRCVGSYRKGAQGVVFSKN